MAESTETALEIAILRREVEDIGSMTEALVRGQPGIRKDVLDAMRGDPVLAAIYSRVNGSRSQGDIQKELSRAGVRGASARGVSERMEKLDQDLHLIKLTRRTKAGNVYARTRLGHALRLDRLLEKEGLG